MIKIEINCEPDFLDAHIRALGFIRTPNVTLGDQGVGIDWGKTQAFNTARHNPERERREVGKSPDLAEPYGRVADAILSGAANYTGSATHIVEGFSPAEDVDDARALSGQPAMPAKANPDRPWGQPSPGKKRRSGAEVAEDEVYYAAHANDPPTVTNTPRAAEAAISTGVERVDPQDAADEAAETVARKGDKLTLEDVRRAVAVWSEKVGPARAIKELRDILGGYSLIELPEAEYSKAIDNLEWAAANPDSKVLTVPNGNAPELKVEESKTATKEDVLVAIIAYGARYDGSKDPEQMPRTKEDLPKVFGELFGKDVTGLGSMPKTPEAFGQITAAIVAATRDNPFRREIRS